MKKQTENSIKKFQSVKGGCFVAKMNMFSSRLFKTVQGHKKQPSAEFFIRTDNLL